MISPIVI